MSCYTIYCGSSHSGSVSKRSVSSYSQEVICIYNYPSPSSFSCGNGRYYPESSCSTQYVTTLYYKSCPNLRCSVAAVVKFTFDAITKIITKDSKFNPPTITNKNGYSNEWVAKDNSYLTLNPQQSYTESTLKSLSYISKYYRTFMFDSSSTKVYANTTFQVPGIPNNNGYSGEWVAKDNSYLILNPQQMYAESTLTSLSYSSRNYRTFMFDSISRKVYANAKLQVPEIQEKKFTYARWVAVNGSDVLTPGKLVDESTIRSTSYTATYYSTITKMLEKKSKNKPNVRFQS